jgi:hypothetical protein
MENMFKDFKMFVKPIPSKVSKVLEGLKDRTFSYLNVLPKKFAFLL